MVVDLHFYTYQGFPHLPQFVECGCQPTEQTIFYTLQVILPITRESQLLEQSSTRSLQFTDFPCNSQTSRQISIEKSDWLSVYKMNTLHILRIRVWSDVTILGADQQEHGLWDENEGKIKRNQCHS